MSGPAWANWVSDLVQNTIAPGTSGTFPVVHLNPENDDVTWQMSMLARWRQRNPHRVTVWSPVAHKAGIWKAAAFKFVDRNIIIAPQCYVGNMERVESANEVLAWTQLGIPPRLLMPFIDGADAGHWWGEAGAGAIAFTQGRLP